MREGTQEPNKMDNIFHASCEDLSTLEDDSVALTAVVEAVLAMPPSEGAVLDEPPEEAALSGRRRSAGACGGSGGDRKPSNRGGLGLARGTACLLPRASR